MRSAERASLTAMATISGTVNKTGILVICSVATAA
jgi:hypothetical protein